MKIINHKIIRAKKLVRCILFLSVGLLIYCKGVTEQENPIIGLYYLESHTQKLGLNHVVKVEIPAIRGELSINDTLYNMFYGLEQSTGDTLADLVISDKHYSGAYDFIGSDSLRLHGMPKSPPYITDWWYHHTASKLTLDNPLITQIWIWRSF